LGGIDPRNKEGNTKGFINETCVIKYNDYEFIWKEKNGLYKPYLKIGSLMIKIINLHIHSKDLQNFLSDNPIEQQFIPFYEK
jgi:hypothetical protein